MQSLKIIKNHKDSHYATFFFLRRRFSADNTKRWLKVILDIEVRIVWDVLQNINLYYWGQGGEAVRQLLTTCKICIWKWEDKLGKSIGRIACTAMVSNLHLDRLDFAGQPLHLLPPILLSATLSSTIAWGFFYIQLFRNFCRNSSSSPPLLILLVIKSSFKTNRTS